MELRLIILHLVNLQQQHGCAERINRTLAIKLNGNFENNTKPSIILGYSSDSPGYHVGDINSKTIIIIQDDIFQIKCNVFLGKGVFLHDIYFHAYGDNASNHCNIGNMKQ
ncbi:hypothetical protein H8356DRAFT_1357665 [Neocallimastix lanati (nom. inval.)]|nr:hypothetical protein H8356DRAFT_1357665 [Neocallimastix sp. JGI-2020a]